MGAWLWLRLKAWLVWGVARLLLLTLRLRILHPERLEAARRSGKPVIYAFWHGRQLALFRANPEARLGVMTSLSRDGEFHSRVCRRFGLSVVRGSSSRGGLGGLMKLSRLLREGVAVGMAVDGPRGPAFEAKPGIAALARHNGSPILPITVGFGRAFIFGRAWDRFQLPGPFTRTVVAYGDPLWVPTQGGTQVLAEVAARLTQALRALTAEVDAEAGSR